MRKLLNTLFITTEDAYLTLDGENVVVRRDSSELARFPLHALEAIISFSYAGASPALMGACTKRGVNLCFCTPNGRFLARATGEANGNVLLRRTQYRYADNPRTSCMDETKDSLRFYYLGNSYETKIEHFGTKSTYEPEGVLMV